MRFSLPALLAFDYNPIRVVVVVEDATVEPQVTEPATMIIVGLILSVFGIGFLCWLLFTLAVYALPFYAGLTAFFAAYHSGAGVLGAIVVGVLAGAATLMIGQFLFASTRSPIARGAIALLYAAPAAIAGFCMTLGLSRIGTPSLIWSDVFAVIGAICVGGTALVRMAAIAGPPAVGPTPTALPPQHP
ncbi:hypothetical protein GCM10011611_16800 [Aliidongia dinghuensis]|uniref:Uncharacterized protein n=1 Tax=Aliidongia dinghuensis TaxID=1867774 RepID=A0A8J3E1G7_9PROT|nr:hypothetical protein [Aliidongia dinghuensis]GGF11771.1 hypothetical protein GCM10011611_16800 [Aliidongia dinghuensis]